ncbi:hypothetical protein [Paenibacillus sp. R14(2021)]|uniref:hypothetical protein n=1 Tax=Paenibacillus sp. R14(2021) TaxID=2859228 RepID=UPI00280BEFA9|nr:hypothetical protein [Paenibacillus sp. R14(2021)]
MEKKVSTSPVGKASTGTVTPPPSKTPTGPKPTMPVVPKPDKPEVHHHHHHHEIKKWCHEHMHRYVLVQTHDGWCCDGFVEHIDDEVVCIAVPMCGSMDRAFFPGQFNQPFYPYPYFPRRRFYRQVFPLAALVALSLLPFY